MNGKRLVITLAAAAAMGLAAGGPGAVYADCATYFGTACEDHGLLAPTNEAPATGGGGAYISPSSEPGQAGPGQVVHPWFGAVDSFEDHGIIGASGDGTGGAAASAPASSSSSNNGVVKSEVFNPSAG